MIEAPQLKGNQPKFFEKEYPNHGKFKYGDFQLSYGYIETCDKPDALVFFWHGMYCYGGMSGYLADVITKSIKKVNIYALDFKNAGLSEGDCPGFYTIEELEDQAIKFV